MNAMSNNSKGGGCGCGKSSKGDCGCGGGTQTGLCACGSVGCASCQNQGFVRPRFFAGQLLTEEDLQKLMDYVVGKNRLHNQRLWGDGVVCGLEVTCNPCGGGTVIVNPGYALDCCGNDLLLACSQTLDINAMVRDLRRNQLGGLDCGDPCAKKNTTVKQIDTEPTGVAQPGEILTIGMIDRSSSQTGVNNDSTTAPDTTRHYCLYLDYCENLTEPVSPYATDEGCTLQSCQPSRITEGVSFELRCHECNDKGDIRDRICECLGDPVSLYQSSRAANYFSALGRLTTQLREVTASPEQGERIEVAELRQSSETFIKSLEPLLARRTTTDAAKTGSLEVGQPKDEPATDLADATSSGKTMSTDEFDDITQEFRDATVYLARYYIARNTVRKLNIELPGGIPRDDEMVKIRTGVLPLLNATRDQIKNLPFLDQERTFYTAIYNRSEILMAGNEPQDEIGVDALQQTSRGFLVSSAELLPSTRVLADLREEMLDRLDRTAGLGDCQLRSDVLNVRIPDANTTESGWSKSSVTVARSWLRIIRDCICSALNPPCGTCDDTAVLLACIEVKDCEVVSICNLKRKFVLSPTALRYWLPPLNDLGQKLEEMCCPETVCGDEGTTTTSTIRGQLVGIAAFANPKPALHSRLNPLIFQLLCSKLKQGGALIPSYGNMRVDELRSLSAYSSAPTSLLDQILIRLLLGFEQPPVTVASSSFDRTALINALNERETRASVMAALAPEIGSNLVANLGSDAVKARLRSVVSDFAPAAADVSALSKKVDSLSSSVSDARISESVAKALKAEAGPTGDAIAGIADDRVAAAIDKLKLTSAVKDLKDLKRIKTENADLKKALADMQERLKKLEGGKPQ